MDGIGGWRARAGRGGSGGNAGGWRSDDDQVNVQGMQDNWGAHEWPQEADGNGQNQIPPVRRRRARALYRMPEVEPSDNEEYSDEASDDGDGDLANPTGVKHLYRESTWKKESFGYIPKPKEFTGCGGPNLMDYYRMPTFMMFFRMFWPDTLL
jgi:hypothetical protein